jgi:DNA polymerase (family 10)
MLEVNAQTDRLDLNDVAIQAARAAGVKLVISTDAHRVEELAWMRYGVDQARRGWCAAGDIANTRSAAAFVALLSK